MSPRIKWIEESDAKGRLAELFESVRSGSISGIKRDYVPGIMQTMSHRPDFLALAPPLASRGKRLGLHPGLRGRDSGLQ